MHDKLPANSVELIEPHTIHISEPIPPECCKTLAEYDIANETYDELGATRSAAILICHSLCGDQHAAGFHCMEARKSGWRESRIGPGRPIDTRRFHIVSLINLGSMQAMQ